MYPVLFIILVFLGIVLFVGPNLRLAGFATLEECITNSSIDECGAILDDFYQKDVDFFKEKRDESGEKDLGHGKKEVEKAPEEVLDEAIDATDDTEVEYVEPSKARFRPKDDDALDKIADYIGEDLTPGGKGKIKSDEAYIEVSTPQYEYHCLDNCPITVTRKGKGIFTSADTSLFYSSDFSKNELDYTIIEGNFSLNDDEWEQNITFIYRVPRNMNQNKVDINVIMDGYSFVLDPVISGCSETATEVFCTGSLTGNTVTTNKTIIISGATIDGTTGADITLSSSTMIIINYSTLNAYGGSGASGNILLRVYNDTDATLKNGVIIVNTSILNSYGGASATASGGSGTFTLNGGLLTNVTIYNSTLNNNGGSGGTAGNGVGQTGGGSTFQTASSLNKIYIFNSTINSVAGSGGSGTGASDSGGNGGGHNIDLLANELIVNQSILILQGGSGGGAADSSGTSGSNSDVVFTANSLVFHNSTITITGGTGGSGGTSNGQAGGGGGTTVFTIASGFLDIYGTTWNGYGGAGGSSSCAAGGGGSSTLTINAQTFLTDSSTLNWYGGGGGAAGTSCSGSSRNGGSGGYNTINIYSNSFNYSFSTLSLYGGTGSAKNWPTATDGVGGNSIVNIITNYTRSTSSTLNTAGGSAPVTPGTSTTKIESKSYELMVADTLTSQYPTSSFNILNITGQQPKIKVNNTNIVYRYYLWCPIKLIIFKLDSNSQNFDFTNCPNYYNTTIQEEFEYPLPFFANNATNATSIYPGRNDDLSLRLDIRDYTNISCFSFAHNLTGTLTNQSVICPPSQSNVSYVNNLTITVPAGNTIGWQVWVNDTYNWSALSEIFTFYVTDHINPNISAVVTNQSASTPKFGDVVQINATLGDNEGLSRFNLTILIGSNYTYIARTISGATLYNLSENFTINSPENTVHSFNISLVDTFGNTNLSQQYTFTTKESNILWLNNQTNFTSPKYGDVVQINITLQSDVLLSNYTFYITLGANTYSTTQSINANSITLIQNYTINSTENSLNKWNISFYDIGGGYNATPNNAFTTRESNILWSNNRTNGTALTFKFGNNIQLNVTLSSDVDLKNYTFNLKLGDNTYTHTKNISGNLHTIFENITINSTENALNWWNVSFWDVGQGFNETSAFTFTTLESNLLWSNNVSNITSPKYGDTIQLNVTLTSDVQLRNYTLYAQIGSSIYTITSNISGTSYLVNHTFLVNSSENTVNYWNVSFFDAGGGYNTTSTFNFTTRESNILWSQNTTNATVFSPKYGHPLQLNTTLTSNVELKNFTLLFKLGDNIYSYSKSISGTSYPFSENVTINSSENTINQWNITFWDMGGGNNATPTFTFLTKESDILWSNNVSNITSPKYGDVIQLNATISSDVGLREYNFTLVMGSTTFSLNSSISGTSYIISYNFSVNSSETTINYWNISFSDIGGGHNATPTFNFTTRESNILWLNNQTNFSSPKYGDVVQINITLQSDVIFKNYTFFISLGNNNYTVSQQSINANLITLIQNYTINSTENSPNKWNISFYDIGGGYNTTPNNIFTTRESNILWLTNQMNVSNPKYGDTVQFNVTLQSDVILKNYTFLIFLGANNYSVFQQPINSNSITISQNYTINSSENSLNSWNVTFYDLGEGYNATQTFPFMTREGNLYWSSNKTNANGSYPKFRDPIQINLTLTSDVGLKNYTFTFEHAGNITQIINPVSGQTHIISENFTINSTVGISNSWNVTFNDIGGGTNSTGTFTFITKNTRPGITSPTINTDTTTDFNNEAYFITANGTFSDVDLNTQNVLREIIWKNGSTTIPNENGIALNCSLYFDTYCAIGQNITVEQRVFDNSSQENNASAWNTSNSIIIDGFYPTSWPNISQSNLTDGDSDGNVEINWTDDINQQGETYRIYRHNSIINTSTITDASLIASGLAEGTSFYEDTTTQSGSTYWYALVTANSAGNYNESYMSNVYNVTANDTIFPQMPLNLSISESGATATLQWTHNTSDIVGNNDTYGMQYVVYYGTSINFSDENASRAITFPSTKTVSTNYTTVTITTTGVYYFIVTSLDDGGNANLSWYNTSNYGAASLTAASSGGGSGGGGGGGGGAGASSGGGGGGGAVASFTKSKYMQIINAFEPQIFKVNSPLISTTTLEFTPVVNIEGGTISVSNTQGRPKFLVEINSWITYEYFEIALDKFSTEDLIGTKIQFVVENAWFKEKDIDASTLNLVRYEDYSKPTFLDVTELNNNGTHTFYSSTTPGFSYFAIVAKENPSIVDKITNFADETDSEQSEKTSPQIEQPSLIDDVSRGPSIWSHIVSFFSSMKLPLFSIHWNIFVLIVALGLFISGGVDLLIHKKPADLKIEKKEGKKEAKPSQEKKKPIGRKMKNEKSKKGRKK